MASNVRISLTILSAGFAIEGAGEVYSLLTAGSFLPGTSLLFLLPAAVTLLGMLFLLVGRHEFDEVHRARVLRAHQIFALSFLAGVVAGTEVAVLATVPALGAPGWAEILFGAAAGTFLFGTFVTYAQLVFHLVSRPSKVALFLSTFWALLVSALIAETLALDLPSILGEIGAHSFQLEYLISPVDYLASFLFLSYFLLFGVYVDAHVVVVRRRALGRALATAGLPRPAPSRPLPEGVAPATEPAAAVPLTASPPVPIPPPASPSAVETEPG